MIWGLIAVGAYAIVAVGLLIRGIRTAVPDPQEARPPREPVQEEHWCETCWTFVPLAHHCVYATVETHPTILPAQAAAQEMDEFMEIWKELEQDAGTKFLATEVMRLISLQAHWYRQTVEQR